MVGKLDPEAVREHLSASALLDILMIGEEVGGEIGELGATPGLLRKRPIRRDAPTFGFFPVRIFQDICIK